VLRVFKVFKEMLELKVLPVSKGQQERKVLRVFKVFKEMLELKVLPVFLVLLELRELLVFKVNKVRQALVFRV
jgi:hypothetical protein